MPQLHAPFLVARVAGVELRRAPMTDLFLEPKRWHRLTLLAALAVEQVLRRNLARIVPEHGIVDLVRLNGFAFVSRVVVGVLVVRRFWRRDGRDCGLEGQLS